MFRKNKDIYHLKCCIHARAPRAGDNVITWLEIYGVRNYSWLENKRDESQQKHQGFARRSHCASPLHKGGSVHK
jgi:hypothetical protein